MAIVEQIETALDIDHIIGGLRLTVIAEMHNSSCCSQEVRVRDCNGLCFTSWCQWDLEAALFLRLFFFDSSDLFDILS